MCETNTILMRRRRIHVCAQRPPQSSLLLKLFSSYSAMPASSLIMCNGCRRCAVAPSVHLLHRFCFEYIFLLLLLLFRRPPFAERNVKDAGVGIDSRGARRWTKP